MVGYLRNYYITNECMDIDYKLTPIGVITFFQDSFAQYLTTKYLAAFDIIKDNMYWVISGFDIEYEKSMPFWSEPVVVDIWVSEVKPAKLYTDFTLSHDGEIFAKGNSCWYVLDKDTKRPIPMSRISHKFDVINQFVLGEHKHYGSNNIKTQINEISHKINLSDIDFNNHVNNISYIRIALSAITDGYKYNHTLKNLNIRFIKESYLDETLICKTYNTHDNNTCISMIEREGTPVCNILTTWKAKDRENSIDDYKLKIRM